MSKNIIFIIGAGASHDLHPQFALGTELLQQISDRVTDRTSISDRHISKLLLKAGIDYSTCWDFVHHLDEYKKNSESPSIDEFLNEISSYPEFSNVKEDFLNIGKFSIIAHILGYEAVLKNRDNQNLRSDAWLNALCQFIEENNLLDITVTHPYNLKLITFNYDRNIEHFIYCYPGFRGKASQIKAFLQNSLLHVYGKIGDLEWQDAKDYFFEYGEANDKVSKIFSQRHAIKLMFPDRLIENENEKIAREWIHTGETGLACTFGFNFDYLNYRLLELNNFNLSHRREKGRFIANVYPYGDEGFKNRRNMAAKIRNIQHDAEITYLSCTDFLNYIFSLIKV